MCDLVEYAQNVIGLDEWRRAHNLPPSKCEAAAETVRLAYAELLGHQRTGVKRSPRTGAPQFFDLDKT